MSAKRVRPDRADQDGSARLLLPRRRLRRQGQSGRRYPAPVKGRDRRPERKAQNIFSGLLKFNDLRITYLRAPQGCFVFGAPAVERALLPDPRPTTWIAPATRVHPDAEAHTLAALFRLFTCQRTLLVEPDALACRQAHSFPSAVRFGEADTTHICRTVNCDSCRPMSRTTRRDKSSRRRHLGSFRTLSRPPRPGALHRVGRLGGPSQPPEPLAWTPSADGGSMPLFVPGVKGTAFELRDRPCEPSC